MDGRSPQELIPRQALQFEWHDVPCRWFGGDPFKSRFFDAKSLLFPAGCDDRLTVLGAAPFGSHAEA